MSNHWSIQCLDCDGEAHAYHINRGADLQAEILCYRAVWEQLGRVTQVREVVFASRKTGLETHIRPAWFAQHAGHTLAVMSEYDYALDDCGEQYSCVDCGTVDWCRRRDGHEGSHHHKRDYDPSDVSVPL